MRANDEGDGKVAWLRVVLGEKRGRGLGTDAVRAFVGMLFESGFRRVECEAYANNEASDRMLARLGFVREGIKREAHFDGTVWRDVHCWGVLAREWAQGSG